MTLTQENQMTPAHAELFTNPVQLHHDVTVMDKNQLDRYVRLAFSGQEDLDFLPYAFWRNAYSMYHRGSGDGRIPDSAGLFFGELHGFVYRIITRHTEVDKCWYDYPVHAEYLDNFKIVFTGIVQECLSNPEPDAKVSQFVSFSVEAAEGVARSYYSDTPYFEIAVFLDAAKQLVTEERYRTLFTDRDTASLSSWWEV